MRPSERSCSVAYELASTVGSRVAGFVTKWPSLIDEVSRPAIASIGIDSCQSTCESYVHAYWKPWRSASWISSSQRENGGSGRTVTPKSIARSLPRRGERGQSRQDAEHDEADPTVARQREREADERCARDDDERRPRVDEPDGRARRVRARRGRAGERLRERDARGEADDRRAHDEHLHRERQREQDAAGPADHEAPGDDRLPVRLREHPAAPDAREEAEEERQRARSRRDRLPVLVVLEERDHPVADDDAEP